MVDIISDHTDFVADGGICISVIAVIFNTWSRGISLKNGSRTQLKKLLIPLPFSGEINQLNDLEALLVVYTNGEKEEDPQTDSLVL